jgi:hypothetical protein
MQQLLSAFNVLAAAAAAKPAGTSTTGGGGFTFSVSPNSTGAPGASGLQSVIDALAAYALYACAAGFIAGGLIWAIGGRVGNDYTATGGKIGLFTSAGVAFLIGAAPKILQWAYGLG